MAVRLVTARERVMVGISGGVDSAVSARLLLERGYEVHGLFMKNWEDDDTATRCTAEEDLAFAAQACDELGIPLHRVNFAREYREQVFEHCLREFRAGRTPNPDVLCNRHIKFRAFLDHARRLGANRIATGHYARLDRRDGRVRLLRGADANKDQSYFLHALTQDQLADVIFPIGELEKPRVREIAEDAGFDNFDRKDSTGICFIGERDFRGFLGRYIATEPGPIVTVGGEPVGEHAGLAFYTIGQRRGLQLGGRAGHEDTPWYVVDKDVAGNRLIVAQGHDHPALVSDGMTAGAMNWIAGAAPPCPFRCTARTRYRQADQPCRVEPLADGRTRVVFDRPQRAVAPGQSVVLYHDAECLGGGVIEARFRLATETPDRASA